MIIRTVHNRENPFVMLNREALNDPKLSLKARGLWATCISKPDNWHFHVSALVKELKEGKTAIYSALNELIEAGYCIRGQKRAVEGGRFDTVEYFLYEFPATEEDKKILEDMYLKNKVPRSGFPDTEKPRAENQPLTNTDSQRKEIDKKHICPDGENASSNDLDEMGHARYIAPPLKGKAKDEYEQLCPEGKKAYQLLMNVYPAHEDDERFNQRVAVRIARYKGLTAVRKGIRVYQQRIKRGETPKKMGGYLKDIIDKGYEPEPEHADDNKKLWQRERGRFPQGSYQEHRDYVSFPRIDKELSWRMSAEVFSDQLRRIKEQLRES